MRSRVLFLLPFAAALLAGQLPAAPKAKPAPQPVPDFTFIHCSDIHVPPGVARRTGPAGGPQFGSAEVVAQIKGLTSPIRLEPYNVTVPAPKFAIATGDLTEFGGLKGWWDQYLQLWQGAPFPVYHESGNHDSTWASQRYQIRKLHGSAYYSFDQFGCHFIGWDSATVQDPRPSFGEEELTWLREDLKKVAPETPVFLFCHHPLESNEFASPYERDRLLDVLRPYNLTLLLVGHGHSPVYRKVAGTDQVMGGSTFGNAPGYAVVSVLNGTVRVAYKRAWEEAATRGLLEKPLPTRSSYPAIRVEDPKEGSTLEKAMLEVSARIEAQGIKEARWEADDNQDRTGALLRHGSKWTADINTAEWEAGCHYLRLVFTGANGETYQRTVRFYLERDAVKVLWRAQLEGSAKGAVLVDRDQVVVGGGDGKLYAFDRKSGKERWSFATGGEILAQPLAIGDAYFFGSGDTHFYCVDRKGKLRWKYAAGHPVYSSAVAVSGKAVVADNNGQVYAFAPGSGEPVWKTALADYSIESKPWVSGDTVYYGAWDGYLYAIDGQTGALRWKTMGAGSAASVPGVMRYYAPADAGPVAAGDAVWVADRMFRLSIMDATSGKLREEREKVASVALAEDGQSVYLRGTEGNLHKVGLDGKSRWSAAAMTNVIPSAPVEAGGVAYSTSPTGRLMAFAAADGKKLWEYQATPRLYVFSDPVVKDGVVYVTGMDGSVTAVRSRNDER